MNDKLELQVLNISKKFKKKVVLRESSFTAEPGMCIGILGGNGSGKTTLLSILAGTLKTDGGCFLWKGTDLLLEKELRSQVVGYVPQGTPLFEELSAKDNLRLWYDKETLKEELESGVLALLGIREFLHTTVNKMSGGMKKRLSIGCAMAGNPQILLMDEPTAALDLVCKQQIWDYLSEFRKMGGIIILVTHDLQELSQCDRCYLLKEGQLVSYQYDGNLKHLVEQL